MSATSVEKSAGVRKFVQLAVFNPATWAPKTVVIGVKEYLRCAPPPPVPKSYRVVLG